MSVWQPGDPVSDVVVEDGRPARFTWQRQIHIVQRIANVTRVDDGWWQQRVWQDRFKLITTTGLLLVLAHDLAADSWAVVRLYD